MSGGPPSIALLNDRIYAYATGDRAAAGGAERQQWLLARALAAHGWPVTIGVRALGADDRRTIDGVVYVGVTKKKSLLGGWHRFLQAEQPTWWYWRCASHLWGPAVELARLARVRTVFAAGFDRDVLPRYALSGRRRLGWPLYAWGLHRSDRILLQHEGQRRELAPRLQARAHLVRSIAPSPVSTTPHDRRPRQVAWVAKLREVKRPDLLLEIARAAPDIRFVVCGGPTTHRSPTGYGERIVRELQQTANVDYRGQVSPEEAEQVIAEAGVLLSTSDEEGFPNTFLQAWSSGTPVATLRIDPDRAIEREGLGVVCRHVAAAARELSQLLAEPARRDAIGERARRHVSERHGEAAVVRDFALAVDAGPVQNGRKT